MRSSLWLLGLSLSACASPQAEPPATPAPAPEGPASTGESEPASPEGGLGLVGTPAPKRRIGQLPKEAVKETMQSRKDDITACYHAAREKSPTLEGSLKFRFVVAEDGKVEELTVSPESTLADEGLRSCVREIVASLTFPKPRDGIVIVNYPFVFEYEDIDKNKKPL